jgi:hypothetical protein
MSIASLTAQLPATAGALPDLFRRADSLTARGDDTSTSPASGDPTNARDEQRALAARVSDDITRQLARRAALGPLTYGARMPSPTDRTAAPIGMRGAHLDVRG